MTLIRSIISRGAALLIPLTITILTDVPHAGADGCFVAAGSIYEPAQLACLIWDRDSGHEELILQVGYEYDGDLDNFAWIVPVPSIPTLTTVDEGLFPELYSLTDPVTRERRSSCDWLEGENFMYAAPGDDGVQVISEETVGIYQTLIVAATDAAALSDSLVEWGYLDVGGEALLTETLQFYIDKSWYFVAMRTESISERGRDLRGFHTGSLDPISLAFQSDEPVYPLRISRYSSHYSAVHLFTIAHRRLEFAGATCQYANDISAAERDQILSRYPALARILPEPIFLTKLVAQMDYADMVDDLTLSETPGNREYRQFRYSGLPVVEVLFLLAVGFLGLRTRRHNGSSRRRSSVIDCPKG